VLSGRRPLTSDNGRVFFTGAFVLAGCTFTGTLTDYDTPECDPTLSYAQDPCAMVDVGKMGCLRSQCDPATKRCSVRPLDEDKDGDPSIACGGSDCDDHDAKRSGKLREICDGIDNDCNSLTDDGLLVATALPDKMLSGARDGGADLTLRTDNGRDGRATYLGYSPSCVHGVTLATGADDLDGGCRSVDVPDAGAAVVRQPQLRTVGSANDTTVGVAFVDDTGAAPCDRERLGFYGGNVSGTGGGVLGDCGAVLPTLASFPASADALIAFYDARLGDRSDPVEGCTLASPAALKVRYVSGATTIAPDLYTSSQASLGDATSTRPPAIVSVASPPALLLASPVGASAGLWALSPGGRVVPLTTSIAALGNARSVAMALRDDGTRLAIVAEQGCKPDQSITLALADFDPARTTLIGGPDSFRKTTIKTGADVATAPSVVWAQARSEWWVAWIDAQQKALVVRVSADGAHLDAPVELGSANAVTLTTAASPSDSPLAFLARPDGAAIGARALICPVSPPPSEHP
jgi:hypothetical protein